MKIRLHQVLTVFLLLLLVGCAIVKTRVSSISHQNIPFESSFYVLTGDNTIESKKIVKLIEGQLQKKMYRLTELDDANIIITFSAGMLGAKTVTGISNTPIKTWVTNPYTGMSVQQTTGYKSQSYSTTTHQREIRIQFHDGRKLRAKEKETILWEAVGKSGGSSADIIMVAPAIIASIFEELGMDTNSKLHVKGTVQKK